MTTQHGYDGSRIAVEEGYLTCEFGDFARSFLHSEEAHHLGLPEGCCRVYGAGSAEGRSAKNLDLGPARIAEIDGSRHAGPRLGSPGAQMLEPNRAVELTQRINDELAEAAARFPYRLAGLASLPSQHPEQAARELERAMSSLGLKGAVIHSHTRGTDWPSEGYLDEPDMWPTSSHARARRAAPTSIPARPRRRCSSRTRITASSARCGAITPRHRSICFG
jgi:5-carboxyvanillate decarboxylase